MTMSLNREENDEIVIVGAGITGLTLAERFSDSGKRVLLIEKRNHIGGNSYDFINEKGVLVSKYGPHIFHTNSENVWKYINKFAKWEKYEHRVLSKVGNKLVPIPVNIETINILFGEHISDEKGMKNFLEKRRDRGILTPKNSKEVVTARLGEEIYELMFKGYTKKQWDMWPEDLEPEVLARIPVKYCFDNRFNSDKYQVRPVGGFTKMFEKMVNDSNIELRLGVDFFDMADEISSGSKIIFSGPVDKYVSRISGIKYALPYRSVKFGWKNYHQDYHQQIGVINYPNIEDQIVRSTEYKYLTGQIHDWTTISEEYFQWEGEPCYPVPTVANRKKYLDIQKQAVKIKNVYFVGRLGKYKYINMDKAIEESLELFEEIQGNTG